MEYSFSGTISPWMVQSFCNHLWDSHLNLIRILLYECIITNVIPKFPFCYRPICTITGSFQWHTFKMVWMVLINWIRCSTFSAVNVSLQSAISCNLLYNESYLSRLVRRNKMRWKRIYYLGMQARCIVTILTLWEIAVHLINGIYNIVFELTLVFMLYLMQQDLYIFSGQLIGCFIHTKWLCIKLPFHVHFCNSIMYFQLSHQFNKGLYYLTIHIRNKLTQGIHQQDIGIWYIMKY